MSNQRYSPEFKDEGRPQVPEHTACAVLALYVVVKIRVTVTDCVCKGSS